MRFKDRTLSITFSYEINALVKSRETTCTIRQVDPDQKAETGKELGRGITYQNPKDPDNKFLARKFAMIKALRAAQFTRVERTAIWDEYLDKLGFQPAV